MGQLVLSSNIKQLKSLAFQHISLCAAIRSLGIFTGPFILAGSSHFTHRIAVATAASTLQLPAAKFGQLGRSDTARTGNNPVARIGLGKMQLPAGSTLCHDRSLSTTPVPYRSLRQQQSVEKRGKSKIFMRPGWRHPSPYRRFLLVVHQKVPLGKGSGGVAGEKSDKLNEKLKNY